MRRDDTIGDALRYLAQHGQAPAKDIARAVGWGPRSAGAKMAGLEKQGLVARAKVAEATFRSDARYEWLLSARGLDLCPPRLTPEHEALRDAARLVVDAEYRREQWGSDTVATFDRAIQALREKLK